MMVVSPEGTAATATDFSFDYWTGVNLGNCGSTGDHFEVITEKRSLKVDVLKGDENGYDFCHYDLLTDFKDKKTLELIMELKK